MRWWSQFGVNLSGDYVVVVGMHLGGKEDVEVEAVYERDLAFEEGKVADKVVFATTGNDVGLVDLGLQPSPLLVGCCHFLLAREDVEKMLIL